MSEYVLQVGDKGFDRLKYLNEVFGDHSRHFLHRAGLRQGLHVLEVGCGTGAMTTWLAGEVGADGRVIAVDASEAQLEIARKAARGAGVSNVEFVGAPAESLKLPEESVDLAYCRLLLMHLRDPRQLLVNLKSCLKPGGVIACEEPHASSLMTTPRHEILEKLNAFFVQLGRLRGLDFDIGDKLFPLLKAAGYSNLRACFIQPILPMSEAIDFVLMGAAEIAPVAIKSGIVSEEEVRSLLSELGRSRGGPDAYYTFPRQAQIYGRK